MNSPPSIFDLAFNPPPPDSSSIFPGLTGSRLAVAQRPLPPYPTYPRDRPRLPSPRLFRGIFADNNGGSQSAQPHARRLPLLHERGDVDLDPAQLAGAITRTSRAVDSVQAAFQPRRSGRNRAVVDLTGSPSDDELTHEHDGDREPEPEPEPGHGHNDGHSRGHGVRQPYPTDPAAYFLSHTTHPLDPPRPRALHALAEPIFGYHILPAPAMDPADGDDGDRADSLARARLRRRPHPLAHRRWINLPRPRNTEQEERDAVRQQQENHAAWQQTQARARQLQNRHQQRPPPESPATASSPSPSLSPSSSPSSSSSSSPGPSPASATIVMAQPKPSGSDAPVEQVDLTTVDSSSAVDALLASQRTDAVLSQRPASATDNGRTRLTAYKCPVCMETPVNATTTICGHLFCHQCIIETLQWSAKQRDGHAPGGRKKCGMCPVCRKLLSIKDVPGTGRTLVPLELRFLVQKRKAGQSAAHDPKGKAKATDDAYADGVAPPSKKLKHEVRETTDDQLWENYINHDLVGTT